MPLEILSRALDKIAQGISSPSFRPYLDLLHHAPANISTVPTYSTSRYDTMPSEISPINPLGINHQGLFERPHYIGITLADLLSLLGSLAVILMVPGVVAHVPSQKKRMLLILFIAISNLGFSTSNIATDLGNASSHAQCTVAVWCYVFFQLLTSSLVVIATFRLCGLFLFKHKHTFPSQFIIVSPVLAFILATIPAIAGQYHYDECGRYCWFVDVDTSDCTLQSAWAWACFYGWMVLFLGILFASTLFVLSKIAIMVMATRSNIKKIVKASTFRSQPEQCTGVDASPGQGDGHPLTPHTAHATLERIRTMSHTFTSRAASIFSFGSHDHHHTDEVHINNFNVIFAQPEQGLERDNALDNHGLSDTLPMRVNLGELSSFGLDSPTLRNEGILADVLPTTNPTSTVEPFFSIESGEALRARERPFVIAILRQALYPISISLSGCVQIFVDLTLTGVAPQDVNLDYIASFTTSIQGFLFFAVFFFDPAVAKTRRHWRKYMVWKYYVEFYFSMGMLQEGNDFEVKFMEHCQKIPVRKPVVSWLMKPPSYSWSNQYDYDAMVPEFLNGPHVTTMNNMRKHRPYHFPGSIPEEETEDQIKYRSPISDIDLSSPSRSHYFDHLVFDHKRGSGSRNGKQKSMEPVPRSEETLPEAGGYTPYTYDHVNDPSGASTSSSSSSSNTASKESRIHPMTRTELLPQEQSPSESVTEIHLDTQTFPLSPLSPQSSAPYSISESDVGRTQPKCRPKILARPSLSAPKPGDVLMLPQLTRVRTIGGSDGTGRYRYHRPSKTPSSRATAALSNGRSIASRLRFTLQGDRSNLTSLVERYQSAFRWPHGAYVMHVLVRCFLVPSSARLPAIKRPPFGDPVIQERMLSVDMIRSGCWNPSSAAEALRGATGPPKKKELVSQALESMSSLSPESESVDMDTRRDPQNMAVEGLSSNTSNQSKL